MLLRKSSTSLRTSKTGGEDNPRKKGDVSTGASGKFLVGVIAEKGPSKKAAGRKKETMLFTVPRRRHFTCEGKTWWHTEGEGGC